MSWFRVCLLFLVAAWCPAWADVSQSINRAFDSLVNATPPSAHSNARRGVIDGGGLYLRNRRVPLDNMVRFNPPRFDPGGCGAIDLQLGSLSFISAQEFESGLRAIAASAGGYLFKLAMSAICTDCEKHMSELLQ